MSDPDLVPATIARSIGFVDMGTGTDAQRLYGLLRDLDLLLVLDNFEQVTPAAGFVAELLAVAPRVSVLVTSRQPLHLRGEHEIAVPPLGPDDAVALFLARARAVVPGFGLDAATEPLVESICAELDRLPLAIELAAARSKVLSPAELHARLGRRLDLLTRGPRDQPDRLRSMHATISWSYDALPPDVQTVFRQLSVFSGGWNLEAAEAICQTAGTSVIEALEVLLDHHLVRRDDTIAESRFSMFETVREFGRHQSAHDDDVRRRHAAHWLAFARTAEAELAGVAPGGVARPDRDRARQHPCGDSVGAASPTPETALDLAGTMWRFWLLRGYATEGLDWIERSIGAAAASPSAVRARALMGAGSMLEAIGDDEAAEARYLAGLHDWEALDDPAGIALAYRHLGNAGVGRGRYAEAIEWYERARRLGAELHDEGMIAGAVSNLGSVAYFQGDLGARRGALARGGRCLPGLGRHQPPGVDPQQPGRAGRSAR